MSMAEIANGDIDGWAGEWNSGGDGWVKGMDERMHGWADRVSADGEGSAQYMNGVLYG